MSKTKVVSFGDFHLCASQVQVCHLTQETISEGLSLLCRTGNGLGHAFVKLDLNNKYAWSTKHNKLHFLYTETLCWGNPCQIVAFDVIFLFICVFQRTGWHSCNQGLHSPAFHRCIQQQPYWSFSPDISAHIALAKGKELSSSCIYKRTFLWLSVSFHSKLGLECSSCSVGWQQCRDKLQRTTFCAAYLPTVVEHGREPANRPGRSGWACFREPQSNRLVCWV